MTISDKRASSMNSIDLDKKTQHLVNFGEFNSICSKIIHQQYRKEKYAKLVSVPSMYRKCCEQILLGISLTTRPDQPIDKKALLKRLEKFVDKEFKMQIQSYRIQFNDFGQDGSKRKERTEGKRRKEELKEDVLQNIGLHLKDERLGASPDPAESGGQ